MNPSRRSAGTIGDRVVFDWGYALAAQAGGIGIAPGGNIS